MGKVRDIEFVWMNIVIFQFFCIIQPRKGYLSLKIVTFHGISYEKNTIFNLCTKNHF